MAKTHSRTWWGQKFLHALERFNDPGRLSRGRSYANGGRIRSYEINHGCINAKVQGSVNPYFGVYKEPTYTTSVKLQANTNEDWQGLIRIIGSRAGLITRLLLNELPTSLEELCQQQGVKLLPGSDKDFSSTCSCPDYANPCKHIAGVCYVLAERLDQDPLLLFELRGLPREALRSALLDTPLGRALADNLAEQTDPEPTPVDSYFTRPTRRDSATLDHAAFWGEADLQPLAPMPTAPALPALLIRQAGDYPPFWELETSFVDLMAEVYQRVRKTNKNSL